MASIRRNNTLHRRHICYKYKCRPVKLDRMQNELNEKRHRIVRQVFLASSFDRWRKLRSTLKLKDSSLAWHLMEAHEKGECSSCRQVFAFANS
ncbi:hypothetical protein PoB_005232500 [Plakobranchus ocellatus]|uniref:Uncharacterized protein n=1 Tax=Plakobranchus ocellatus TaxID=259542 RepID=A0AAV4C2H0_9GAST|nr:hypothetical protein PoB_005232500 [Plakobranchus ocellatus]